MWTISAPFAAGGNARTHAIGTSAMNDLQFTMDGT
jgi:hypothetical protein